MLDRTRSKCAVTYLVAAFDPNLKVNFSNTPFSRKSYSCLVDGLRAFLNDHQTVTLPKMRQMRKPLGDCGSRREFRGREVKFKSDCK